MTDIPMPRLSDSMEHGTILTWLIDDGQPVARGEDLLEIETDKATMTHQADVEGILTIVAPEGDTLAVGETIARIGVSSASVPQRPGGPPAAVAPTPMATNKSSRSSVATPLARRIAEVQGVTLADLLGSGPRGRITRADVLAAAGVRAPAPRRAVVVATPRAVAPRDPARGEVEVRTPTRIQQVIAERMAQAKATIPHFQVQTEVAMDAAIALRTQLKAAARESDTVPSLNDLVVKASALALREHPLANGAYRDGAFELHARINVGVAVAADAAVVVPTVYDADMKSIGEIGRDVRALAGRVRSGVIRPEDLAGGTFTVSNLGMYGMTAITPVINAPQAAILGVGALRPTLARIGDEIVDRTLMTLTLSCDHRILYGADAAVFLREIRERLEEPLMIAL